MAAADRAFAVEDWETVVSKAYYAVYHSIISLLEIRAGVSRRRWDHIQVQRDFLGHFAERGFLFSMRDLRDLSLLYEERLRADYGRESVSRRAANDLLQGHAGFIRESLR